MELKQYWNVIWKRRWLVLTIVILTGLISAFLALTSPRSYRGEVVLSTRYDATADNANKLVFNYNDYYRWFSSEFIVDDYTQIIETTAFANSVIDTMKKEGEAGRLETKDLPKFKATIATLKPEDVTAAIGSDRRHRELRVFAVTPNRELTKAMLDASSIVLTSARLQPIRGKVDDKAVFAQLDQVTIDDLQSSTSKDITNAITRVIMGLVAALALAFLLEYLDGSVRDERDAQRVLDIPVLGAIPRT